MPRRATACLLYTSFARPSDDRGLATHGVIALVADGMGGCNGGEVASTIACQKIPQVYFASNGPAPAALRASLEAVNTCLLYTSRE